MSKSNNNFGFTLVELILTIALLGTLIGLSIPVYNRFQYSNSIELATMEFVQAGRRAQALARASDGDSNWGVYIDTGQIILFKGDSYGTRDVNYDEDYFIASNISITGIQEIVFEKFSGNPQLGGSTAFTINANANKTITINDKGVFSY